jgi:hypothetical protein
MSEGIELVDMLREQAKVHDHQKCCGLPLCVSCRCAAIFKMHMCVELAEMWINKQPEGTIVRLPEGT